MKPTPRFLLASSFLIPLGNAFAKCSKDAFAFFNRCVQWDEPVFSGTARVQYFWMEMDERVVYFLQGMLGGGPDLVAQYLPPEISHEALLATVTTWAEALGLPTEISQTNDNPAA